MKVTAVFFRELPGLPDEEVKAFALDTSNPQEREKAPWLFSTLELIELKGGKVEPGQKLYPYARGGYRIISVED